MRQKQLTHTSTQLSFRNETKETSQETEGIKFKDGPVKFQSKKKEETEGGIPKSLDDILIKQQEAIKRAEERMEKEK